MTRRRRLEWAEGRTIDLTEEGDGPPAIVLAHGAGAGQQHPFMAGMRRRLAASQRVITFDYPYIAEGRRAPDRMPVLLACHRAVVEAIGAERLVLGGKSMGGRMASHLEAPDAVALFFLGYPLVAIGKPEPRDTSHLEEITAPMLFVQGERDRLGPPDLLGPVVGRLPSASMVVVPDADHSFKVPKRAGIDEGAMLDLLAETVVRWLASQAGGGS
jgi:predicted alpha/beta-hydrolase family hydrolase